MRWPSGKSTCLWIMKLRVQAITRFSLFSLKSSYRVRNQCHNHNHYNSRNGILVFILWFSSTHFSVTFSSTSMFWTYSHHCEWIVFCGLDSHVKGGPMELSPHVPREQFLACKSCTVCQKEQRFSPAMLIVHSQYWGLYMHQPWTYPTVHIRCIMWCGVLRISHLQTIDP